MEYKILNNINSPADVKKLNNDEIKLLCDEIRFEIIDVVSKNGGHLASSLGAVELTIALHRVFSSPRDMRTNYLQVERILFLLFVKKGEYLVLCVLMRANTILL